MATGNGAVPGRGRAGVELCGTVPQQLVFLITHWGREYSFTAPARRGDRWRARARFGQHGQLAADTAADLLERVHAHYEANKPGRDGPL